MNGCMIARTFMVLTVLLGIHGTSSAWGVAYAIGGAQEDGGEVVYETSSGGFVISGFTESFGAGDYDLVHMEMDSSGALAWAWTVGGPDEESSEDMIPISGGGFVVTGYTESFGTGGDLWLMEFNASGALQWAKTFGGSGFEGGWNIAATSDGGSVVVGETDSYGSGNVDFLVVKFDATGNVQWAKAVGGGGWDVGLGIDQTSDGGYIVTGECWSWGPGNSDVLLVKLDASGEVLWAKAWGGNQNEYGGTVVETPDNGILMTCASNSFGSGDFQTCWVKFDSSGGFVWAKTVGGPDSDWGNSTLLTSDGGYAIFGSVYYESPGQEEVAVVRIDPSLSISWTTALGGIDNEDCWCGTQTASGDFLLTGETWSYGAGERDILVAGLDADGSICIGESEAFSMTDISPTIVTATPASVTIPLSSVSISPTVMAFTPAINDLCPSGISEAEGFGNTGPMLMVHPNPCIGSATLTALLPGEDTATLIVFDLTGRAVTTVTQGEILPEGESMWTVSDFVPGLYLVRLESDGMSVTERMVVLE